MRARKGGAVGGANRNRVAAARTGPFLAEGQVACPGVQLQRLLQLRPVAADKAAKPAVMIAVRMAQDHPVEFLRGDAEQIEIAVQHLGREAKIEQILIALSRSLGFEMQ